jgi:hypothetical protein
VSRANYSDDLDQWDLIRWRGQVKSAIRGARGQAFFRELITALDAMPEKKLVRMEFEQDGCYCTLGVIARQRGVDLGSFDPDDSEVGEQIGNALGIAHQLAREIMYENDEWSNWSIDSGRLPDDPAKRWQYMRAWVAAQIVVTPEECGALEVDDAVLKRLADQIGGCP